MLPFQTPSTVFESPHSKMGKIIELAWGFSTVLGILLFLVEIMIIRYINVPVIVSLVCERVVFEKKVPAPIWALKKPQ